MWKLLPLVLAGCASMCSRPTPTNLTTDSTFCDAAQAQLLKLACTEFPDGGPLLGGPNASGVSFGDRCRLSEKNGVPMAAQCISTTTSCNQVNTCLQGS